MPTRRIRSGRASAQGTTTKCCGGTATRAINTQPRVVAGDQLGRAGTYAVRRSSLGAVGNDAETAVALESDDVQMDRLYGDIFTMLTDGTWTYGTDRDVDATLVGRSYER